MVAVSKAPQERRTVKVIAYLRAGDVEQLDALGARLERPRSWLVDLAVKKLLVSALARVPDSEPSVAP